ncbi:MAG: hypothetical protein U5R31_08515 [Acidimicrobiia bacterium]|nr:hypothetical protein [Acidimicrobiia bacterium]
MSRQHTDQQPGASTALAVLGVGLMATMAAFVALIVAGIAAADLFPATSGTANAATDRGVWMATQAWANPLAITGVAVLFGLAIPLALRNVRSAIDHRRDAMVTALPTLMNGADR